MNEPSCMASSSAAGELNLLLLFNMIAAGNLPPASGREYVPLG